MSSVVSARFAVTTLAFYCLRSQLVQSSRSITWHAVSENTSVNLEEFKEFQTEGIVLCSLKVSTAQPPPNVFCFGIGQCLYNSVILENSGGEQREGLNCYYSRSTQKTPPQTCSSPFTQYSFGCMLFDVTERDFNGSVEFCQSLGANLASLDTQEDFDNLRSTLMSEFENEEEFWVLVNYNDGVWTWGKNGRPIVEPSSSGEWGAAEPNEIPGQMHVRMAARLKFLLADTSPSEEKGVICHVWHV